MSIVVRIWLWPSSSMTTRGCTFSLSSSVAAVCRPSCSRTSPDAGLGEQPLPGEPGRLPLDRLPVRLSEDQVVVLREGAGRDLLLELGRPVGAERLDERA